MSEVPLYHETKRRVLKQVMRPTYKGTSLIRNRRSLRPYSKTIPRALWGS